MASYLDSIHEYCALLKAPKLVPAMLDSHPEDPLQLFQDWNVFACVCKLLAVELCLLAHFFNALNTAVASVSISGAFIIDCVLFFWIIVLVHHFAWYFVVKRSGGCGPCSYLIWSLVYMLLTISALSLRFV